MCSVEYVNTSELFLGVYNSHGLSVLYAQSYESHFFYLHTTYLYLIILCVNSTFVPFLQVLAYYISFLKTLSLKLNRHTVHFFFNEVS